MLLTITTDRQPASDLSFLLHKHPDRFQTFDLSFGKAHVYYPEVGTERCTASIVMPPGSSWSDRDGRQDVQNQSGQNQGGQA